MTSTTEMIQNRIREIKKQQPRVSALQVPMKPAPKKWRWTTFAPAFLGSCIVLLTMATVGLMVNKNAQQQIAKVDRRPSQPIIQPETSVDTSQFLTNDQAHRFLTTQDGEKMVSGVQERLDSLEAKVSTWEHRTWLLSLAVNENANLAGQRHNAGYITFNKDWKMSGLPTTMALPEEIKVKLQEADLAIQAATGVSNTCTNHHYVMESDNSHYHCTSCGARYARQSNGIFKRVK